MTPTPCCSGISGKTPGVYVLDANTTVIVPNGSKRRSSNRGVLRHSNLSIADPILSQCASLHLSGMGPFSLEQEDAYDQCVADRRADRRAGRLATYQNMAEWFACAFMGKCKDQPAPGNGNGGGGGQNPPETGMGSIALWVGVIILLLILTVLAVKFFGKKGG